MIPLSITFFNPKISNPGNIDALTTASPLIAPPPKVEEVKLLVNAVKM